MNGKIAAVLLLTAAGISYEENNRLTLCRLSVESSRLPKEFNGFSIVHLSDLHSKYFGSGQNRLLRRINQLAPDLVCITGDLIDKRRYHRNGIAPALALCRELAQERPVILVSGNHEAAFPFYPELQRALEDIGVTVLENQALRFYREGAVLYIGGLQDPAFIRENRTAFRQEVFRLCREAKGDFTLLLCHRPELLEEYGAAGADLVLSGHAHGGQFRLPGAGPVWVPNQGLFPSLAQGVHRFGNTAMVVSRGLGNSLFPQRLLNWPEVVFITLNRQEPSLVKETGKK